MKRQIVLGCLICIIAFYIGFCPIFASSENTNEMQDVLGEVAVSMLLAGYEDYYNISNYSSIILERECTDNMVSEELFVTFWGTMVEDSIEEVAFVQGMYTALKNIDDEISVIGLQSLDLQNEKEIATISEEQFVTYMANKEIESYARYIGVETDFNFCLKVEAEVVDGVIMEDSIHVYAENGLEYVTLESLFPQSRNALFEEGYAQVLSFENMFESGISVDTFAPYSLSSEIQYGKMVQYVTTYTSNPTECDCGKAGCTLQKSSMWNGTEYGYYSALLHNDCADYISQAMYYAGITEDHAWYAEQYGTTRSSAWAAVEDLERHMTNRGVWSSISSEQATYGDIIRYTNQSHVVMITYRDANGVIKYSGHTHDRLNFVTTLNNDTMIYYRVNF